jgi:plasmid stability protein
MSLTLTISELDQELEERLRQRAAAHDRTVEAEAREILQKGLAFPNSVKLADAENSTPETRLARIQKMRGAWKDRSDGKTTVEIMRELRGDEYPNGPA